MKLIPSVREFLADHLIQLSEEDALSCIVECEMSLAELNKMGVPFTGEPFMAHTKEKAIDMLMGVIFDNSQ